MNSLEKMLGRIRMAVLFFLVPAILFLLFIENVTDRRVATMADEFIMEATKDGKLTRDEYIVFANALASFEQGYEIELEHQYYVDSPYYEYTDKDTLHDYFKNRNVRVLSYVPVEPVVFSAPVTAGLQLQERTNATVLASVSSGGYVPLPEEGVLPGGVIYEPVIPVQECYSEEQLVTIVRVQNSGVVYYLECDAVTVTGNGTARIELEYNGLPVSAFVDVTVYPRTYMCAHGHEMVRTKEMIEEYKMTGSYGSCAQCAMIPENITVNAPSLSAEVGTSWEELALTFTVTFLDGHSEIITFDKKGLYHDYDANYCGQQTVTVSYLGYKEDCFDITLNGKNCASSCGNRCDGRSYQDYLRFNYCNECLASSPFFFGETYVQEDVVHQEEIAEILDNEGTYYFNRGDYLKVTILRVSPGIPIPFLSEQRAISVVTDGFIRTSGR